MWSPLCPARDVARRLLVLLAGFGALALLLAAPSAASTECRAGHGSVDVVGKPGPVVAWRAALSSRVPTHARVPGKKKTRRARTARKVGPGDAPWLLVMRAKNDRKGRCWVRVRLPWRPNEAGAWIRAQHVNLRPTRWRIRVNIDERKLVLRRGGRAVLRTSVVIGAPITPTPEGLFSIVGVWRWNPADFLGSYILPLTAHSPVLQEFGGGDGRVGIHGRGGASLLAPLGSMASHGCIRLPNGAIESVVRRVGAGGLPGIPVRVR